MPEVPDRVTGTGAEGLFVRRRAVYAAFFVLFQIVTGGLSITTAYAGGLDVVAQAEAMPRAELTIVTGRGERRFDVEVATTPADRANGLMFREKLAFGSGMIFVFEQEGAINMWMKNTILSLDMLFISGDGRIVSIAAGTTPMSLEIVSSEGPAKAVLEVAAGTVRLLGIAVGDRVISPALAATP